MNSILPFSIPLPLNRPAIQFGNQTPQTLKTIEELHINAQAKQALSTLAQEIELGNREEAKIVILETHNLQLFEDTIKVLSGDDANPSTPSKITTDKYTDSSFPETFFNTMNQTAQLEGHAFVVADKLTIQAVIRKRGNSSFIDELRKANPNLTIILKSSSQSAALNTASPISPLNILTKTLENNPNALKQLTPQVITL